MTENVDPDGPSALELIEAPSDLIPGVYEGGMRVWECSLDLVEYLDGRNDIQDYRGKRIIEVSPHLCFVVHLQLLIGWLWNCHPVHVSLNQDIELAKSRTKRNPATSPRLQQIRPRAYHLSKCSLSMV